MVGKEKKKLRDFGLVVGAVFVAIGLAGLVKGHDVKAWAVILGGVLMSLGLALPASLGWPYRLWMKVGHVLMVVNTKVILSLLFFFVVCPTGVLLRLSGRDLLGLKGNADTYWLPRETEVKRENYERQF